MKRDLRIAIVGAGPGGLCMGIRLKEAGFEDFVILEKEAGVGGTWFHNRYPGCACDIPSFLYCFSFDVKSDWSRPYAPQPEILAYLESVAKKNDLLPHCRFGNGVRAARWDEGTGSWTLSMESGESLEVDVLVSGIGMFNELNYPEIEGIDSFAGAQFHSARWNWNHDLTDETVAVIGSAASAVQFVPQIIGEAAQVHMYQRTANWILPKEDDPYTKEQLDQLRADPSIAQAFRQAIFNEIDSNGAIAFERIRPDMEASCLENIAHVEDPEIRAKLTPDHPWGCKRPLFSNDYYPAFNRPNLELVTGAIARITPTGVVTEDGTERRADTIIFATGFQTTKYLSAIDVTGRDELSIQDAWADGAIAYKGVTTAGFPNLFMLYGPNTNADSIITTIEYQVDHALRHIQRIADEGLAWLDVKPEAMAEYNEKLQADIATVEPWKAGCTDYYRGPGGRIVTQWPNTMSDFEKVLQADESESFEVGVTQG